MRLSELRGQGVGMRSVIALSAAAEARSNLPSAQQTENRLKSRPEKTFVCRLERQSEGKRVNSLKYAVLSVGV